MDLSELGQPGLHSEMLSGKKKVSVEYSYLVFKATTCGGVEGSSRYESSSRILKLVDSFVLQLLGIMPMS